MTITQRIVLPASPAAIYRLYLKAQLHSEATGAVARIESRVGGKMSAWDGYIRGRFLQLAPGKLIVQSWRAGDWSRADPDSVLVLELEKVAAGCRIALCHAGVPAHQAASLKAGWTKYYWSPLRRAIKRGLLSSK